MVAQIACQKPISALKGLIDRRTNRIIVFVYRVSSWRNQNRQLQLRADFLLKLANNACFGFVLMRRICLYLFYFPRFP